MLQSHWLLNAYHENLLVINYCQLDCQWTSLLMLLNINTFVYLTCTQSTSVDQVIALNLSKQSQHIATLLGATCCMRLTTLFCCVVTCWLKFDHLQP